MGKNVGRFFKDNVESFVGKSFYNVYWFNVLQIVSKESYDFIILFTFILLMLLFGFVIVFS